MRSWALQEARSHLRDVVDAALSDGPQRITRRGKQAVIVVSEAEWVKRDAPRQSFGEWLVSCPVTPEDLPPRKAGPARDHDMFG